tara:strand:+ start:3267 stop:3809 length:543 start_codon:yes stop_codon:yes gene_type:complete
MTLKFSVTYTGCHPLLLLWTSAPSFFVIVGTDGPQISISSNPTAHFSLLSESSLAIACAIVDFPTPPFPDNTSTIRLHFASRLAIASSSSLGPSDFLNFPVAHSFWFGHPSHADDVPAAADVGPTQFAFAFGGGRSSGSIIIIDFDTPLFSLSLSRFVTTKKMVFFFGVFYFFIFKEFRV